MEGIIRILSRLSKTGVRGGSDFWAKSLKTVEIKNLWILNWVEDYAEGRSAKHPLDTGLGAAESAADDGT